VSLLELRNVNKRSERLGRDRLLLENASMGVDGGELVAVWGLRGSGRTTLLRIASGIDTPDSGTVTFEGRDLTRCGEQILGHQISYCQKSFRTAQGQNAIDEVIVGVLVKGATPAQARVRANEALDRVDGANLALRRISDLDGVERTRLALAHALAQQPRLLVIDEPVAGVDLQDRDAVLMLLRSLADEGIAVLMTVGDVTGLSGADQALTIGDGELRGSGKRELAPVTDLSMRRRASG